MGLRTRAGFLVVGAWAFLVEMGRQVSADGGPDGSVQEAEKGRISLPTCASLLSSLRSLQLPGLGEKQ